MYGHIDLVNLKEIIPTIELDIRYATTDNFTCQQIYTSALAYVRTEMACALKKVQEELATQGFGLKVWDAYRPHSVQFNLWEIVPDVRYVADPHKGSRHNRGAAVDVTLIRLDTKVELEMPTEFDNFTEKSWRTCNDISDEAKKNRQLLEDIMTKHGFIGLETEWWHFDYKEWQKYNTLDVLFEELS
jgi:D-alanyl-D-alanine dipeptidase